MTCWRSLILSGLWWRILSKKSPYWIGKRLQRKHAKVINSSTNWVKSKAPHSTYHRHKNNQSSAVVIYKVSCQIQSFVSTVKSNEFVDRVLISVVPFLYHLEQTVRLEGWDSKLDPWMPLAAPLWFSRIRFIWLKNKYANNLGLALI